MIVTKATYGIKIIDTNKIILSDGTGSGAIEYMPRQMNFLFLVSMY